MSPKKKLIIAFSIILIAPTVLLNLFKVTVRDKPLVSTGGIELNISPKKDTAYFLQDDPRWGSDKLGGSQEKFSSTGCLVCAISMAGSELGYDVTPKQLNIELKNLEGFTKEGLIIWSKIKDATKGNLRSVVVSDFSHSDIDEALKNGVIPVVKYYIAPGVPHWIPIVGKKGFEYLIKDSLDSTKSISNLSRKAQEIVSLRLIKKN